MGAMALSKGAQDDCQQAGKTGERNAREQQLRRSVWTTLACTGNFIRFALVIAEDDVGGH